PLHECHCRAAHALALVVANKTATNPTGFLPCGGPQPKERDWMSKSIFLSYARGDDEPFVARPAFLHQIRDAINARERFLFVLGSKATTGDYVAAEWQQAVTFGKAIN